MYLIAGVTGRTGSAVAEALLAAGKPVRVLVRRGAQGQPWRQRGAEVSVGSLDDPRALSDALRGASGAYLLSPQNPRSLDPIADGWRYADAIARAVEDEQLSHLVMLSAVPAGEGEAGGIARTLRAAEARLATVQTPVTFVRGGYLLENWAPVLPAAAGGVLPSFLDPDRPLPMVATGDVAAVAAAALLEGPRMPRERIEVSGPEEYNPRQVAAALARLLDRPVDVQGLPLTQMDAVFTAAGASPAFAAEVRLLHAAINDGKLVLGADGARLARGRTDLDSFFEPLVA